MLILPPFLNRKTNGIVSAPVLSPKKNKPKIAKPPKAKKWRGAERVHLHLADQCHSIGSGHRYVWAKIGTVWVHLADNNGGRGKIDIKTFNKLRIG
jgi:hypothetical protein|tara:strand:+ start:463 stop:750 length:288 start_codon:yes stop_codon:yes gene_type:complete